MNEKYGYNELAEKNNTTPFKVLLRQFTNFIVWVLFAAFLVFWMQAGFGMVEAGFTRAKNAANILMKNFMDFSVFVRF